MHFAVVPSTKLVIPGKAGIHCLCSSGFFRNASQNVSPPSRG